MASADPSSRRNVLVVCFGNLCRSPMAEGLFRAALPANEWAVRSAGTHAIGDDPPTAGAQRAVNKLAALDIGKQRSALLTVDALRRADFVFTMSRQQALEAASLLPDAAPRIRLLGAFAPDGDSPGAGPADPTGRPAEAGEIADPMGGSAEEYEACCRQLQTCVEAAARWLQDGADPGDAPATVAAWLERP